MQIKIYANFRLSIYIHIYTSIYLQKKCFFSILKSKENFFICRTAYLTPVERHYFCNASFCADLSSYKSGSRHNRPLSDTLLLNDS